MSRYAGPCLLTAVFSAGFAGQAAAHMYTQFPAYTRGGIPNKSDINAFYQEFSTSSIYINISHACAHTPSKYPDQEDNYLTDIVSSQVVVVPPVGPNAVIVENLKSPYDFLKLSQYKELGPAGKWALIHENYSETKPFANPALPHLYTFYAEDQPAYFTPASAMVWTGEGVPDKTVADISFEMTTPPIPATSCVQEVDYFFAAAQFCPKTTGKSPYNKDNIFAMAWLLSTTNEWTEELLGGAPDQWSPYIRIMRDLKANPLPKKCGGVGTVVSVYPGKEDIDQYLRPVVVNKQGEARQIPVQQWIRKNQ